MAIYLDYNATSPLLTLALERLTESARLRPGNPSSVHWFGQEARNRLEECRRELAAWVGADSGGLVFTSGGSESNALALRGFAPGLLSGSSAPVHVIGSPMDHPSVVENLEWLERQGAELSWLPSGGDGTVEVEALPELLRPNTRLVAFAGANNETGVVQPIRRGVELIQQAGRGAGCPPDRRVWFYTDLAQAAGRMELAIKDWGVDGATLCAHKMGGPRGVGAL
ncbi:MAG: aminotransferase class V-fold PLP-dependent enzyme, partial [Deltaproteobacteria bacterium]|nr:aminotransferase class V-fold PLP-dependent enzyme [Deltaproteobacteria bacterium]